MALDPITGLKKTQQRDDIPIDIRLAKRLNLADLDGRGSLSGTGSVFTPADVGHSIIDVIQRAIDEGRIVGIGAVSTVTATLAGTILTVDVNGISDTEDLSSLAGTSALNSGNIFVGNVTNVATGVTMSGDATIDNAGVITVNPASQVQSGIVEMANNTEADAGASNTLALSPANGEATYVKKTSINAKGDVIFGSANNTTTVLPASGNNGASLIEDSTTISGWNNMRNNYEAATAPGIGDDAGDGYRVGSVWVDTVANEFYICANNSAGAAVWVTSGSGSLTSVTDGTGFDLFITGGNTVNFAYDFIELTENVTPAVTDWLISENNGGGTFRKVQIDNVVPDASLTVKGKIEIADNTEATAGIASDKAMTPFTTHFAHPAKSTLTTKGDIYAAASTSNPIRLGVGTNGQVLTADSAETTGLKWADAGSNIIQYTSGTATIWATGPGVTFAKSGTNSSINTFTVPTGVDVKRIAFNFTNVETDAGDLFVGFVFADVRAYNVSYRTALIPHGGVIPANASLPLATPINITHFSQNATNGDKIIQVSKLAEGTGSDIEFKFQGMNTIATNNELFMNFGIF